MQGIMYDDFGTRYKLVQQNPGMYNWLFFPGGPGADSSYFLPLIERIKLPGNVWLIDFKANGSNCENETLYNYNFDQWFEHFLPAIKRFDHPIYVGHSFGGLLPLLFPELEDILEGLIIMSSSPKIDLEKVKMLRSSKGIVIPVEPFQAFLKNPGIDTFTETLLAMAPCHFTAQGLDQGKDLFKNLPFNFYAQIWAMKKLDYINNRAVWVPQHIPVLILGGNEDYINPIALYRADDRFKRSNITVHVIQDAGHFPWIEKMNDVVHAMQLYVDFKLQVDKGN